MNSKSIEMQEVREIGRSDAGESRIFSILWMGITKEDFQMERKEYKKQAKCKRYVPEQGICFSLGDATLSGPVARKMRGCSSHRKFTRGDREQKEQ